MNTFPLSTVESGSQVKEDALPEMVGLWDGRTQFTRKELGGAPDWARWVDRDGYLFDMTDVFDAFNEMLDSTRPPIQIVGVQISPHMALWAQPSDYKHKCWCWLGDLIAAGELREVVDDARA
nr:MAG TPA: hypothetical protein [Caudoviricetes sp.]